MSVPRCDTDYPDPFSINTLSQRTAKRKDSPVASPFSFKDLVLPDPTQLKLLQNVVGVRNCWFANKLSQEKVRYWKQDELTYFWVELNDGSRDDYLRAQSCVKHFTAVLKMVPDGIVSKDQCELKHGGKKRRNKNVYIIGPKNESPKGAKRLRSTDDDKENYRVQPRPYQRVTVTTQTLPLSLQQQACRPLSASPSQPIREVRQHRYLLRSQRATQPAAPSLHPVSLPQVRFQYITLQQQYLQALSPESQFRPYPPLTQQHQPSQSPQQEQQQQQQNPEPVAAGPKMTGGMLETLDDDYWFLTEDLWPPELIN